MARRRRACVIEEGPIAEWFGGIDGEENIQKSRSSCLRASGPHAVLRRPNDRGRATGGRRQIQPDQIGSEVLNFKKRGHLVYGYFETPMANPETSLERIDPAAARASSLDDVLVIFVASHPERGQVIVGWYRSAKVLRAPKHRPAPDDDHDYRCVAIISDAVLLPDSKRVYTIPTGAGAMGQSNVCYPLRTDGSPKDAAWMANALDYVRTYSGENLLVDEIADAEANIAAEAENALSRAQGRWVADPKQRKALEDYGVRASHGVLPQEGLRRRECRSQVVV